MKKEWEVEREETRMKEGKEKERNKQIEEAKGRDRKGRREKRKREKKKVAQDKKNTQCDPHFFSSFLLLTHLPPHFLPPFPHSSLILPLSSHTHLT